MKFLIKLIFWAVAIFLIFHFVFDINLNDVLTLKEKANSSICDKPVRYKIGSIDPNFKINESEFLNKIQEASDLWKDAYGKTLFVYDTNSDLEINLIYDERQENLDKIENSESEVLLESASVEEQNRIYDQKVAELEKQVDELNKQIDYWNSKGGAPEAEFKYLTKMQEDLNKKVEELNDLADNLNRVVGEVNKNIDNFNQMVSKFNNIVMEKPEIGLCTSGEEKIDIYFFSDEDNLVDTLAHEMGHSLGLDHIENENAIMNPVVSENTELTDADVELIKNYCSEHTYINEYKTKIKNVFDIAKSKIELPIN